MLEFLGLLFLIGLAVALFPLALAGLAILFCLIMAAGCWVKEKLTS